MSATTGPPVGALRGRLSERFGGGAPLLPLGVLFTIELLDQANQSAYGLLVPNLREIFHLTNAGILLISAIGGAGALLCTVPVAILADRTSLRVRIALVGAGVSALFAIGLGAATSAVIAAVALCGMSMGQAVIFPTHNSLLADYYPVQVRQRIFYAHRGGVSFGALSGVLIGAGLTALFSWRAPFFFFSVPIAGAVALGVRLREPPRGRHEQAALSARMAELGNGNRSALASGDDGDVALGEADQREHPPSFGEAWRMVWKIGALRRIFYALPMLSAAIAGFASLASLQYQETFHLGVSERAYLSAPIQVFHLLGLVAGAMVATRLNRRGLRRIFSMLGVAALSASAFSALFALAPSVPVAFVANAGIELSLAVVGPGVLAALSLAIPARARSIGFSITSLFVLPGLIVLPLVGVLGDHFGFRYGLLLAVPVFAVGGLIVSSAGSVIDRDVTNVWTSMATRARMLADRHRGRLPLLAVRDLTVGYDGVNVIEGLDLDISEGEIVALLGTNGAGKSTLLRAIGGVVEASGGAVVFDGRDITHVPPDEIARLGIVQVPGGAGIFPSLSVGENLRAANWQSRHQPDGAERIGRALGVFPDLAARLVERAGNLSGGQQQMLALAMALLGRPRLLLIDELSLGLAPRVVEDLLSSVQALRATGTAVLLVEQSVDVAVSVADRGYVIESGSIRFAGTATEIAREPELLRAIYLHPGTGGRRVGTVGTPSAPPEATPALKVVEASLAFGGITALDQVSLAANPAEILGIIGPNGAGKTSLFDVVSGFEAPMGGRVLLHGIDVTARPPALRARLGLGRLFQDSRLFASLSVREALAVALERFIDVSDPLNAMLRLPAHVDTEAAVSERVDELIESFGLTRYAEHLVAELSTGLRRLVDLAAVMALQPDVVLLDEPASGVAQREVEAMIEVLHRVRDRLEATLLVVEHNIAFVSVLADRLVAMDRGAVVATGSPGDVLASAAVEAAFLGTGAPIGERRHR